MRVRQRGYAICTVARSGSNWLCRLLSSTGVLGKPMEYFNGRGLRLFTDPAYPDDPAEQLARVLTAGATPNGVYGLKVFAWLVDLVSPHARWTEALPNLRFVHLERRDLLGQAMSQLRANQTQQWRSALPVSGEAKYDGAAILNYLHAIVREQARWASFFARTGAEPLRLVYEDVAERPQAAVDAVARLMDVEPVAFDPDRVEMAVQRDSVTEAWRARFLAEHGDAGYVDTI